MTQPLTERLRERAVEWFEMCGDIHEPLNEAASRIDALEATQAELVEALTPSGDTKAAYMGEFSFTIMQAQEDEHGEAIECPVKVYVPWTTIKEIMAAIRKRAKLEAGQ